MIYSAYVIDVSVATSMSSSLDESLSLHSISIFTAQMIQPCLVKVHISNREAVHMR